MRIEQWERVPRRERLGQRTGRKREPEFQRRRRIPAPVELRETEFAASRKQPLYCENQIASIGTKISTLSGARNRDTPLHRHMRPSKARTRQLRPWSHSSVMSVRSVDAPNFTTKNFEASSLAVSLAATFV